MEAESEYNLSIIGMAINRTKSPIADSIPGVSHFVVLSFAVTLPISSLGKFKMNFQWKKWSGARRLIIPTFSSSTTLETATAPAVYKDLVRVRPSAIKFTQDNVQFRFQDGHTLYETALQIARQDVSKRDIGMINVVRTREGTLFALDNRRLAVFRLLEICGRVRTIKVEMVPVTTCVDEWNRKLTTTNGGESIEIRGTHYRIGKTSSDTIFQGLNQIREAGPTRDILSDERFTIFLNAFTDK